ncbi:acetolactate synthase catalytic subunit [Mesorhizobium sp. B4-1-4]|uniref:acetolactate synthase catalytic subunit n=1 Tax=Mesorhizobium sp. B4-1-4 TaxID=2589888 RepID=UPI00112A522F|nr:acetolactate synthase catalytic subunit [Mesorhizobium sp. B4-1-4]UCI31840.1 acetolactate synthase catalytic subunit [Mesorhizobium sp. B4-1-4]
MPASASNSTVALRLGEALVRHGVVTTFGQSLPSAFHLAAPHLGISQTVYRQENMGGTMADGYARISRKVGIVTAQNGPAATLLVPPLAEALKASVPVVALVQEVTRETVDKNAFQELDHVKLFEGVSKFVRRIDRAERLDDYVDMAFTAATSGRPGPAVLLLPADLLIEKAEAGSKRRISLGTFPLDRCLADPSRIEAAARLLADADRPVVIAGGGIHISDASGELARLQEDAHLPVATTFMGKGSVDETHPLSIGVVGNTMGMGARTRELKSTINEADVVLLVGNRTNQNGTDSWTLYPKSARFIHIDADPTEVGRNYEALRLVGDAKLTLAALRTAILKLDLMKRSASRAAVEGRIAEAVTRWTGLIKAVTERDGKNVRPERVAAEIDRRLGASDIITADASYSSNWINTYMTAKAAGQRFLAPRGLAGLGWGVPLAIGAQVAAPQARVVALVGDGGFGHSWAELETLRRLQLPVIIVVLNNGILGFQTHAEDVKFGEHTIACDFADVDHAAIARACGIDAERVEVGEAVGPALDRAFASGKPYLLEIKTDPTAKPPLTLFSGHFPEPF